MQYVPDESSYDARRADGTLKPNDWSAIPLAIIKVGEGMAWDGSYGLDPAFHMQWDAAKGRPRMAYHFFRSNKNAIQQATGVWNAVKGDFLSSDFIALDFETRDGMTASACLAAAGSFLYEIEKRVTAARAFLYTYPSFWNALGGGSRTGFAKYPLWLAQWPWDNWLISIALPPKLWTAATYAQKKYLIDTGQVRPMYLAPWSNPSRPTLPAIWQWTARLDPALIPGYMSCKKAVDCNAIMNLNLPDVPAPAPVPPSPFPAQYRTTTGLYLMPTPDYTHPSIGHVNIGTIVTVTAVVGTFARISPTGGYLPMSNLIRL